MRPVRKLERAVRPTPATPRESVAMPDVSPLRLLLVAIAGWVHREQADAIAYLVEESRVLKEQLGGKCVRLTDDQRR